MYKLIERGWNVNESRHKDGCTPLHTAVVVRNYGLVKMLIRHGAMVGAGDHLGNTALMKCLKSRRDNIGWNIVELLCYHCSLNYSVIIVA